MNGIVQRVKQSGKPACKPEIHLAWISVADISGSLKAKYLLRKLDATLIQN